MNDLLILAWVSVAGAGLGVMFFGGLWWTLRKAMNSEWPGLWFVSSVLVRVSITLVGFYLLSAGQWQRIVACLVGFLAARLAVTWLTRLRSAASPRLPLSPKANDAPQS